MVRRPLPVTRGELRLAVVGPIVAGRRSWSWASLADPPGSRQPEGWRSWSGWRPAGSPGWLAASGSVRSVSVTAPPQAASAAGGSPLARAPAAAPSEAIASAWLQPGAQAGSRGCSRSPASRCCRSASTSSATRPGSSGQRLGPADRGQPALHAARRDTGQTLAELTGSMYQYHDSLRALARRLVAVVGVAARPQAGLVLPGAATRTAPRALIYDTGNLVIFWLGMPAWASRLGRLAPTQPVADSRDHPLGGDVAALGAHRPGHVPVPRLHQPAVRGAGPGLLPGRAVARAGARAWLLARVAAALAIVAAPLLWLLRTPLCMLAGTAEAHAGGAACASEVNRTAQLSQGGTAALTVLAVGAAIAAALAWRATHRAGRAGRDRTPRSGTAPRPTPLAWSIVVALLTLGGVVAAMRSSTPPPRPR